MDWLLHLFDSSGFTPRWFCGEWSETLGWTHIVSDVVTFLAYSTIPILLASLIRKRGDLPFPRLFWLFGGFIFACGTVHLVEAIIFWQPHYRLSAALKVATALFSVATVLALIPVVPRALALPGLRTVNEELSRQIAERERVARELEAANSRLAELAVLDPLTGLLNRRGLCERLELARLALEREGEPACAVLIDCDDFKRVNDRFGHAAGDALLRELATRMKSAVRGQDTLARLGGDEFLLILHDTREAEGFEISERLRSALFERPFQVPGGEVRQTASLSIQPLDPDSARDLELIVTRGSEQLRVAKAAGKNQVHGTLPHAPGCAGDRCQLEPWTQDIVDLGTGEVVGVEFLIRCDAATGLSPQELFRSSRARGLLVETDLQCLRRCLEAAERAGPGAVHVNLFPETLEALAGVGLEQMFAGHAGVCIEINEEMLVGDPARLAPARAQLRELGVEVAVDDVGFGRSSLEALLVLEPEVLKIDRRKVKGIGTDPAKRRQLERMLGIARALHARVVAEGIEDAEDAAAATALGIRLGQGFHLGRPRPFDLDPNSRSEGRSLLETNGNPS